MPDTNIQQGPSESPMEATTYGGVLRIARENKDLSIDQVSSQLRITPDQIEGLEADNYHVFPTPVYARAHLRSYARLLGVDEAKVIALFNASLAPDEKDPRSFIRKTTQDLAPYHDVQPKNPIGKFVAGILFLAVLIALGWIGFNYYLAQKSAPQESAVQSSVLPAAEQTSANKVSSGESAEQPSAEATKPVLEPDTASAGAAASAANQAQREAEMKLKLQQEAEAKAAEAKAAEEKRLAEEVAKKEGTAAEAPASEVKTLTLTHNEAEKHWELIVPKSNQSTYSVTIGAAKDGECWFGIYQEGKLVHNAQLKNGDTRTYDVPYPFKVSVGNRTKGFVKIDGSPVDLEINNRQGSTVFTIVQK